MTIVRADIKQKKKPVKCLQLVTKPIKSIICLSGWLVLRAVILFSPGTDALSLSCLRILLYFFYAFLIQSESPAARVHICAIGFFHFLLVSLFAPTAVNIPPVAPD